MGDEVLEVAIGNYGEWAMKFEEWAWRGVFVNAADVRFVLGSKQEGEGAVYPWICDVIHMYWINLEELSGMTFERAQVSFDFSALQGFKCLYRVRSEQCPWALAP